MVMVIGLVIGMGMRAAKNRTNFPVNPKRGNQNPTSKKPQGCQNFGQELFFMNDRDLMSQTYICFRLKLIAATSSVLDKEGK